MASRSAIEAGKAFLTFSLNDKEFKKQLRDMRTRMKKFANDARKVGGAMAAGGAAILAPLTGAVLKAGDFAETMSKFNTVFGDQAGAVKAWGDEFAKQVGRSQSQIAGFLSQAQDTFVPLGFDPAEAQEMSKEISKLAVDLASFNNMTDQEAFDRLMGAMVGNTENLRAFGVVAQDAQVKAQAMAMGFDEKNLTPYQKALAIMELTMKGTTAAQGDAIKTAGSFNNQMKAAKAAVEDAAVALGEQLLPVATKLITKLVELIRPLAEWVSNNSRLVQSLAGLGAVLAGGGISLLIAGQLTSSVLTLTTALQSSAVAAGAASAAIGAFAAVALIALIRAAYEAGVEMSGLNDELERAAALDNQMRNRQGNIDRARQAEMGDIDDPEERQKALMAEREEVLKWVKARDAQLKSLNKQAKAEDRWYGSKIADALREEARELVKARDERVRYANSLLDAAESAGRAAKKQKELNDVVAEDPAADMGGMQEWLNGGDQKEAWDNFDKSWDELTKKDEKKVAPLIASSRAVQSVGARSALTGGGLASATNASQTIVDLTRDSNRLLEDIRNNTTEGQTVGVG